MAYQSTFKRYELKYLLTRAQKELILLAMRPYMSPDQYGCTVIRNLYYDTENYRLIRASIEKPIYKEKLRLRSYRQLNAGESAFVELKKKYNDVVYKRRIQLNEQTAMSWLSGSKVFEPKSQIGREISYFRQFYQSLRPVVFLSYERQAWYCKNGGDFRVTFDDHILCRTDRLSLTQEPGGTALLDEDTVLMELKTSGGIPLWMSRVLTENKLYKTSFSKYGTAYKQLIFQGAHQNVGQTI